MKKRAMEKRIPQGNYCYELTHEDSAIGFRKQFCPWRTMRSGKAYCSYLHISEEECDLLWDDIKACNIHN